MPRARAQRGQAIALIALMITVLIGMVALAVDGARGYAMRRDLQAAVDAAALAASDSLQQSGSYPAAEQSATTVFAANLKLYSTPGCSPGYLAPGPDGLTVTCTYPDHTVLTQVVTNLGPGGAVFRLNATRSLQLDFAGLLTNGVSPRVAVSSGGSVNSLLYAPAVAALGQAGCGGTSGSALTVNGTGTLSVTGDVVADGAVAIPAGALAVAGDTFARCQATLPAGAASGCYPSGAAAPCTWPDVAGTVRSGFRLGDPGYPAPAIPGQSQATPASGVVIQPGSYASNPLIAAGRCYFLSAGVYAWRAGYKANGGFVSNELKPPDEPDPTNNQAVSAHQFWNTNNVNCAGSFKVTTSSGSGWSVGTFGFELTSLRADVYQGTTYQRESAPSRCVSVTVQAIQTVTLQVSNVPGATSYNIYMSSNGCSGPFGLVYTLAVSGIPENDNLSPCPWNAGCSLLQESISAPTFTLPALPGPNPAAAPGTPGAYPPQAESAPVRSGLPNQNAPRGTPPAGGRGNENECDTTGGALTTCPAGVTPGAVVFYLPAGACLSLTGSSDTYIFSGYQYDWISVYEPGAGNPPANTCANVIGAAANSALVGLVYAPAASIAVQSGATFLSAGTGGLMGDTVSFTGTLPSIVYSVNYAPTPPASRLTY